MKGNDKKMIWRRWRRDLEEEHLDLQPAFKEHTRERRQRRCFFLSHDRRLARHRHGKHGRPLGIHCCQLVGDRRSLHGTSRAPCRCVRACARALARAREMESEDIKERRTEPPRRLDGVSPALRGRRRRAQMRAGAGNDGALVAAAARPAAGGHGRRVGAMGTRRRHGQNLWSGFCFLAATFLSSKGDGIAGMNRRTKQNKCRTKKYPRFILFCCRYCIGDCRR